MERCYAACVLPSATRALWLTLGLASCATGGLGSGSPPDDAGVGPEDASVDSGPSQDTGSPVDSGSVDTGARVDSGPIDGGAGDTGLASDAPSDVAKDSSPAGDGGCPGHGTSEALLTFDLSSLSGITTSVMPTTTVAGVTGGALSRSAALTAVSASGGFNSSGWGSGSSADATKYDTFTVIPAAGCTVMLSSVALDVSASGSGPTNGDVATSANAFATHSTAFAGTSTPTVTLTASGTGAVEVRIYGYGATSSGGTMRIQNTLTLTGSVN